jgi:hypothetical protein
MKMKEIEQNRNDENKIKMESRQGESVKNLQNNEPSRRRRQCRNQLDKIKTNIVGAAREVLGAKRIDKTCTVDNINEWVRGKNSGIERMTYNRVVEKRHLTEEDQQEDQEKGGVTTMAK